MLLVQRDPSSYGVRTVASSKSAELIHFHLQFVYCTEYETDENARMLPHSRNTTMSGMNPNDDEWLVS